MKSTRPEWKAVSLTFSGFTVAAGLILLAAWWLFSTLMFYDPRPAAIRSYIGAAIVLGTTFIIGIAILMTRDKIGGNKPVYILAFRTLYILCPFQILVLMCSWPVALLFFGLDPDVLAFVFVAQPPSIIINFFSLLLLRRGAKWAAIALISMSVAVLSLRGFWISIGEPIATPIINNLAVCLAISTVFSFAFLLLGSDKLRCFIFREDCAEGEKA